MLILCGSFTGRDRMARLRAGMKKYEYKGKQWHEQCFCCKVCLQPIGNKSFIPRDQEVVCVQCYEEQYAQRCMKCNGVSTSLAQPIPITSPLAIL